MALVKSGLESAKGDEILLGDTAVLTRLDKALGWARKFSIFPYPFATACCAMEYMSLSMSPYDIDRFGALLAHARFAHARIFQQWLCQCRRAARSSASPMIPSVRQATRPS